MPKIRGSEKPNDFDRYTSPVIRSARGALSGTRGCVQGDGGKTLGGESVGGAYKSIYRRLKASEGCEPRKKISLKLHCFGRSDGRPLHLTREETVSG